MTELFSRGEVAAIECAIPEEYEGTRIAVRFDSNAVQFPMSCAWLHDASGTSTFTFCDFEPGLLVDTVVERWLSSLELFFAYTRLVSPDGSAVINFNDAGLEPGFAFAGNSPDHVLIPDSMFLGTHGYAKERKYFQNHTRSWSERSSAVFWRGTAIGRKESALFEMPRVRLCEMAKTAPNGWFDIGLVESFEVSESDAQQMAAAGLMKPRVTWKQLSDFRFHIDIDGHANTYAALFRKLLSGGLVLKVTSPDHCRQWYYDRLKPWKNFVPIRSDLGDLLEVTAYCREHDALSQRIAENGRRLALSMTYEREFVRALAAIRKTFARRCLA